ncbi:sugar-binding transcriptional regulator [Arthrobacter sp. Hz1]
MESDVRNQSQGELLARIGREYYLENRPKVDIAASYGLSRFQVARLLTEARESGIVEITVHFPSHISATDLKRIETSLNVGQVIVVDTATDEIRAREILAKSAAKEISRQAPEGGTLGISWSRTLDLASRHIVELPRCDIVQLAGALPAAAKGNPLELIQRLGHLSGGVTWPLWSPLVVEDPSTAAELLRQPEIAGALSKADSLDLAVVAIGAWKSGASTVWDRVNPEVRQSAMLAGAVAECSGRLLNSKGVPVESGLDERIIAVTIKQLQQTPRVIAIAQGIARAEAVRAVALAGFVTTLIVDEPLAKALNDLTEEEENQ